jgi:hypothetical protein
MICSLMYMNGDGVDVIPARQKRGIVDENTGNVISHKHAQR